MTAMTAESQEATIVAAYRTMSPTIVERSQLLCFSCQISRIQDAGYWGRTAIRSLVDRDVDPASTDGAFENHRDAAGHPLMADDDSAHPL